MLTKRPFIVEALTAIALLLAPFILPHLGFAPATINHILVWGLFGIGFDILFGYTGLLSFGQSAFFGTGGMVAAYLLTVVGFHHEIIAVVIGMIASAAVGCLVGLIALRRTGIYFAMITVAISEVFYFVEFNPLSNFTGGENGLPGVPEPSINLGFMTFDFNTDRSMYFFVAFWYFLGIVLALRIVRSPVGLILTAIRDNPRRAQAVGHTIQHYKLAAFVIASAYAGFAGGLLGLMQGFMPPDAFTFDTSGQLVMQAAIGGSGTLFGPLVGATIWLYLRDFLQSALDLGAAWKLALGIIFVLLVVFLRHGVIGGLIALMQLARGKQANETAEPHLHSDSDAELVAASHDAAPTRPVRKSGSGRPIIEARKISKRYGGLLANSDIDFQVAEGELRGVIGPNGAGKTTFFKMLTCEVPPTGGQILFNGQDITGHNVTAACQLGLTKSYQINQLFTRLTVRENITIAALAKLRGSFRLDLLRSLGRVPGLNERVDTALRLVRLTERANAPVSALAYGEKRRLEIGLALASDPQLLLLDEPLAGMSPRERMETVKLLKSIREGRTMIVIDHDMDAIFDLAEKITVLSEGKVLIEGTPQEIKNDPVVQEAYLGGLNE